MTAPEDAITALRRARPQLPDDVVSPASVAAQALLEEILSMRTPEIDLLPTDPVTDVADVAGARPAPRRARRSRRTSRRPLVLAAAAAVAVGGIAAVAVMAGTGDSDGGGPSVEVGPEAGDRALPADATGSGRLRVAHDLRWASGPPTGEVTTYSWSGEDFGVQRGLERSGDADGRQWRCSVDIDALPPGGGDPVEGVPLDCDEIPPPRPEALDIDPATLLDRLAAGPYTPVGDEDVEGVPTEHRRATNPAAADLGALRLAPAFPDDATVTAVDVWVDGDGLVRRVDVATGGVAQGGDFTETSSYVWFDLGEPITIEPPAPGELVTADDLDELLAYSTDMPVVDDPDAPMEVVPVPDDEAESGG